MSSSSNKGVEKPGNESAKQKTTSETFGVDEINVGVGDLGVKSDQNDGWLVCARESKNNDGSSSAGKKQWIPQNPTSKSWGHPDVIQNFGMRSNVASSISPVSDDDVMARESDREDDELDLPDDDSDEAEFLSSDDLDDHSDVKEMSFEERKKSRWFKKFFECLDKLTITKINDPERQWHCPACKGGPGEIMWFTGLQSLVVHTKTKGGSRIKLHRELAQLLEEELRLRGTTVVPASEVYGQWDGIEYEDKEILWPPMVIIMNTALAKDDSEKRIGMRNQELREYFSSCTLINSVRHSYGPQGHRGISVLIFEATAMGYIQAQVLCEQFSVKGRDKDAWERNPVRFSPGGIRKLYGYMAEVKDMANFNQHSHGKARLKFEMKSYNETVRDPVMQMSEDNQQLVWFKTEAAKNKKKYKALEETLPLVSEKHRQTVEENKIIRMKMKMQCEQNKEEMESQQNFFKDQINMFLNARTAEEDKSEKIQQERCEIFQQSFANAFPTIEDHRVRAEKAENFVKLQDKDMEEFVAERENLIRAHVGRRHKLLEEAIAIEKRFDFELAKLVEKFSSKQSKQEMEDFIAIADPHNQPLPVPLHLIWR
ncbi:hypothetical protein R3W88_014166 [Solanum pinnatisectum]|uniref:Uncharacterized protein n=1 Tax=Solanum pinnatisectum TaxID=50273 RepID=A0AAV9KS87_9SOLN|nr:hypothetical protein R3W88_014166 [Solanum pinnatisectum]